MKPIGSYLPSSELPKIADLPTNSIPPEVMARARRLWLRMTEMFGHRWTTHYGNEPTTTWVSGLATLTDQQIARGLRTTATAGHDWPPSLPQFYAWARDNSGEMPMSMTQPPLEVDYERRRAMVEDMKRVLRNESPLGPAAESLGDKIKAQAAKVGGGG